MPLDRYREKRDFTKTPEPAGDVRPREGRERFFCVQKHLASHLHYDFRLEHHGVLLSWAVPKGPSLDPTARRLAMQVEDHPLDYGTFEGVIPEGYGAGIVLLWDEGTWEPEGPDVDRAIAKGDLKFRLNGYKLKGSWVLVRTRGTSARYGGSPKDEGRSWLLIKHRDEWAGPVDVTQFAESVKSHGDFADVLAQEQPDVWLSHRPARGGETGAMFARIIERALALKADRAKTEAPGHHVRKTAGKKPAAKKKPASVKKKTAAERAPANRTAKVARKKAGPARKRRRPSDP
jgi:bifunctional non-homologous end joining protein LigD